MYLHVLFSEQLDSINLPKAQITTNKHMVIFGYKGRHNHTEVGVSVIR